MHENPGITMRYLKSAAIVLVGAAAGIALYLLSAFILAAIGFYTLSFGTGAFAALALAGVITAMCALATRNTTPDSTSGPLRLLAAGFLGVLALLCVAAIVWMPELIAFWPH
jgi:hypothetical protein